MSVSVCLSGCPECVDVIVCKVFACVRVFLRLNCHMWRSNSQQLCTVPSEQGYRLASRTTPLISIDVLLIKLLVKADCHSVKRAALHNAAVHTRSGAASRGDVNGRRKSEFLKVTSCDYTQIGPRGIFALSQLTG